MNHNRCIDIQLSNHHAQSKPFLEDSRTKRTNPWLATGKVTDYRVVWTVQCTSVLTKVNSFTEYRLTLMGQTKSCI